MGIIRFLFAICVVTVHVPFKTFHFFDSILAVRSFFVISGFYMALILNEKYSSYGSFLMNRFLRIYPIYWLVLCFSFILVLFHHNFFAVPFWYLLSVPSFIFVILTHLLIIGQDIVTFMGFNVLNGSLFFAKNPFNLDYPLNQCLLVGQAWSVSIELIFYLIAPFLVKRKPWLILLIILLSTLLRLGMGAIGLNNDPWSYRFFPFELTYFCLGILSYKIYAQLKKSRARWDSLNNLFHYPCLYRRISIYSGSLF